MPGGVPRNRAVLIRSALPNGKHRIGSGTLIGGGLVLTAAHVVFDGGLPLPTVEIAPDPQSDAGPATVVWPARYHPNKIPGRGLDAALLEITDPGDGWPDSVRTEVRFGRVTGRAGELRCEAIGYPRSLAGPDGLRVEDQMSGTINPASGAIAGRHDITVTSAVPGAQGKGEASPWAGASGAGVFVNGLLAAVLVVDLPKFPHNRLTAVPMRRLLADPGAREILDGHGLLEQSCGGIQSVELVELFVPAWPIHPSLLSPSVMLRADTEVVSFHGRSGELSVHEGWCFENGPNLGVRLLFGPGGQGKTRLARQLMHMVTERDWVAGFLRSDTGGQNADFAPIADTSADVAGILLITDYAETRSRQFGRLLPLLSEASDVPPIRLLLLARTDGDWWRDLRIEHHHALNAATQFRLLPLDLDAVARKDAFEEAVAAFAKALHAMDEKRKWLECAADVTSPQDLSSDKYAVPLMLQMSALLALLQAGGEPDALASLDPAGLPLERLMLEHEQRYWKRTAAEYGISLHPATLAIAVAAATFLGAATKSEALATLAQLPGLRDQREDRLFAIDGWLRDLYPSSPGQHWGRLEPDRIAEHHIGALATDDPGLIDSLLSTATDEQAAIALAALRRAATHQPHLTAQLRDVIAKRKNRLERAALSVALMAQNPSLTLSSAMESAYETVGFEYRQLTWEQWLGPDREPGS